MKFLLLFLLLSSCAEFTTSIHRCDNKVGPEKEACIEAYKNHDRHMRYMDFRGGRGDR